MKKKLTLFLRIFLLLLATIIVLLSSDIIRQVINHDPYGDALSNLFAALSLFGIVYLFRTKWDKESMQSIGLKFKGKNTLQGAGLAIILVSVVFVILLILKQINVRNINFTFLPLIVSVVIYACVGFFEEIVFRAYIQTNIANASNYKWGIIISALLFTLLHGLNPDLSIIAVVNIYLAGIFLSVLYHRSGNLWLPIGFHAAWNYWQGTILGFAVSGTDEYSLLNLDLAGPDYLTGSMFGLEGSVICTIILLISIIIGLFKK